MRLFVIALFCCFGCVDQEQNMGTLPPGEREVPANPRERSVLESDGAQCPNQDGPVDCTWFVGGAQCDLSFDALEMLTAMSCSVDGMTYRCDRMPTAFLCRWADDPSCGNVYNLRGIFDGYLCDTQLHERIWGTVRDAGVSDASASDLSGVPMAYRVLFIVDTSQTMSTSDPDLLRVLEPDRAIRGHIVDPYVSFGIIEMNDAPSYLTTTGTSSRSYLTRDRVLLGQALLDLRATGSVARFADATALMKQSLSTDMTYIKVLPNQQTRYRIFLFSDGLSIARVDRAAIIDNVMALQVQAATHGVQSVQLSTALLLDPGASVDPMVLADSIGFLTTLAQAGRGRFTNYMTGGVIDFQGAIGP